MSKKLSLIIPCYNEEKTLEAIVECVMKIKTNDLQLELVIVDDCSKDKSLAVACALMEKYGEIKVVQHKVNQGKGAALRTGFLETTGDFVGIQDADMEYAPEDYHIMLEPLLSDKADVVYGSRYLRLDTRRVLYFWHTWMNKALTRCSNMFTNLDITDMETCYKLFRRDVIHEIAPKLRESRFGFEPEITARVSQAGCRVYECAIQYNPRTYDEGKKIGWKDGVWALYCILHYGANTAPIPMQLILYFFIGGVSAVGNLVCFSILFSFNIPLLYAIVSAFVFSAAVNYILCILILFRHKARWNTAGEVFAYIGTMTIMGLLDYSITFGLVTSGVSAFWSKFWATIGGFFGNFILRKYMVFPEKPHAGFESHG